MDAPHPWETLSYSRRAFMLCALSTGHCHRKQVTIPNAVAVTSPRAHPQTLDTWNLRAPQLSFPHLSRFPQLAGAHTARGRAPHHSRMQSHGVHPFVGGTLRGLCPLSCPSVCPHLNTFSTSTGAKAAQPRTVPTAPGSHDNIVPAVSVGWVGQCPCAAGWGMGWETTYNSTPGNQGNGHSSRPGFPAGEGATTAQPSHSRT